MLKNAFSLPNVTRPPDLLVKIPEIIVSCSKRSTKSNKNHQKIKPVIKPKKKKKKEI